MPAVVKVREISYEELKSKPPKIQTLFANYARLNKSIDLVDHTADPVYAAVVKDLQDKRIPSLIIDAVAAKQVIESQKLNEIALWAVFEGQIAVEDYATLNLLLSLSEDLKITKIASQPLLMGDELSKFFIDIFNIERFEEVIAEMEGARQAFQYDRKDLVKCLKQLPPALLEAPVICLESTDYFDLNRACDMFSAAAFMAKGWDSGSFYISPLHFDVIKAIQRVINPGVDCNFQIGFSPKKTIVEEAGTLARLVSLAPISGPLKFYKKVHWLGVGVRGNVTAHDIVHLSAVMFYSERVERAIKTLLASIDAIYFEGSAHKRSDYIYSILDRNLYLSREGLEEAKESGDVMPYSDMTELLTRMRNYTSQVWDDNVALTRDDLIPEFLMLAIEVQLNDKCRDENIDFNKLINELFKQAPDVVALIERHKAFIEGNRKLGPYVIAQFLGYRELAQAVGDLIDYDINEYRAAQRYMNESSVSSLKAGLWAAAPKDEGLRRPLTKSYGL
jgi:uncharacterized protein YdcH (DUF465 family)